MKTKHTVTLYTALLVTMMSAVLMALGYYETSHTFYRHILNEQESRMRVAWNVLAQQGGNFHVESGRLLAGNVVLNGNEEMVDRIATLMGGTVTIFQGDRRIATNVRLPDGSRAVGTLLVHKPAAKALFTQHRNFRGEATILGEPYVIAYDLIKDPDGHVLGVLQVGKERSAYAGLLRSILRRSLLVTVLGAVLVGLVVYLTLHSLTHELQRIAGRYESLLDAMGEGIYGVDREGRFIFINHMGAEMLGYSPEELMGREMHSTIHHSRAGGAAYPLATCQLCTAFATEKNRRHDEVFWRKDGSSFPVRYHSSPMLHQGVAQGAVVAFDDMTDHKRAKAEIHASLCKVVHGSRRTVPGPGVLALALLGMAMSATPLFAVPPDPVSPTNQTAVAGEAADATPPAAVPAQAVEGPSAKPSPAAGDAPPFHTIGSGPSGEKRIALTFDDGPDPVITPKVLGELRARGVKATFFVLGERVRLHPEILREMVAEGHEIGNHTYSHRHLPRLSNEEIEDEITRTQSLIKQAIGYEPSLFRPPYGTFRPDSRTVFEKHHLNVVLWSVDPKDWSVREEGKMYDDLIAHVHNGSIVLCHDIHHAIVDALPRILDTLLAEGYQFATVSELCGLLPPARGETIPFEQPDESSSPTQ